MNLIPASRPGSSSSSSSSASSLQLRNPDSDDQGGGAAVEHLFDKVVTPSDVGKLNRLVIPKQYAEKYFPLDSSSNDKGLLLNFEDRNGKPWRFRYSYWNSSQSYVITKGWSRFVKEKKLDAGDVVSFHRSKDRLFIDWRRRVTTTTAATVFPIPQYRWANPFFLHHPGPSRENYSHHLQPNVAVSSYYYNNQQQLLSAPPNYFRSAEVGAASVGDARPVVQQKQFRLFGVNMDYPIPETTSSSVGIKDSGEFSPNLNEIEKKGKGSMSLDLDI